MGGQRVRQCSTIVRQLFDNCSTISGTLSGLVWGLGWSVAAAVGTFAKRRTSTFHNIQEHYNRFISRRDRSQNVRHVQIGSSILSRTLSNNVEHGFALVCRDGSMLSKTLSHASRVIPRGHAWQVSAATDDSGTHTAPDREPEIVEQLSNNCRTLSNSLTPQLDLLAKTPL